MFIQRYCVYASPTEQAQLAQVAERGTTTQKVARRARIVLMLAQQASPMVVARTLHVSRMTVRLWARRFVAEGVPGVLRDATRPGRRPRLTLTKVQAIVDATLTTRPPAGTHWSSRALAEAQGVSDGTIRKIWRQHGLQPHRVGQFKLSTDPHFVEKLRDVVGLYLNPPAKAVVFCVDEKSGIQALDRTRPVLPLRPGVPERQTHDYVRYGTTTLYAALRVLDGVVIGECRRRHRSQEFVQFLRRLERATPPDQPLHLILDNLSAHKSPQVRRWLTRHPRVHFHFVPTSSSWLNLVERWFAEITRTRLRRGTFTSVPALERAIHDYLTHYNQHAKPFIWTKDADTILEKVDGYPGRLKMMLEVRDGVFGVVKDRRGQRGVGLPFGKYFDEVVKGAGPARGDYRYRHRIGHLGGERAVEAALGAVTVDRRQKDLAGPAAGGLARPLHGVPFCRLLSAAHIDLKTVARPFGIDGHDDGLTSVSARERRDQ